MTKQYIVSDFNYNEEFDYLNAPKHFKSITDRSIRDIRRRCVRTALQYDGQDSPAALKALLQAINGDFNMAYSQVDGDEDARRANLQAAYTKGLADLGAKILDFRKTVDDHDKLFKKYADAMEQATGDRPDDSLKYGLAEVKELEKEYNELKK